MAVTSTTLRNSVYIKLVTGTDSKGNDVLNSLALGSLKASGFDSSKAMAIVNALEPCLAHSVHSVQHMATSVLENE